ncbi:hypothetical protein [Streptomyces sp. NPDC060022]|uniref:hypothetical protein n=1 Tax=Streptomyces sp. NPDC060022 TaxID=3347039 RepID=UPI0036ABA130
MAKSDHQSCRTAIRARELGRWIGMSESTIGHDVLPAWRASDAVRYRATTASSGRTTGLECVVMPLWRAHHASDVTHPLALSKRELVTLLRLIEALFAPGWGLEATPAGLLAEHRGKGAATDRLALLMLVLQAGSDGRVRMVGGSVPKGRGRAAATVARLLGCSIAGGGKVLARLRSYDVIHTVRLSTGSGLFGKSRLVIPVVVATAHRQTGPHTSSPGTAESPAVGVRATAAEKCTQPVGVGEGHTSICSHGQPNCATLGADAGRKGLCVERSDTATGEHPSGDRPQTLGATGRTHGTATGCTEVAERPGAAALHTHHPVQAELSVISAKCSCFSGEAVNGYGDLPKRAGAHVAVGPRRTQTAQAEQARTPDSGSLREEQPDPSPLGNDRNRQPEASRQALADWFAKSGGPPKVCAPLPKGLEDVLAPVEPLWRRLERLGARHRVLVAVRAELAHLRGAFGSLAAERLLADRLRRRKVAQQAPVKDPVGWLINRALPRRSACYDQRCDDGHRMDTGLQCPSCQMLQADRRSLRQTATAQLAANLPSGIPPQLRKELIENLLREKATAEAIRRTAQEEQTAAERAAREGAAAERRARYEAAEAARQARPCVVCGRGGAGGLCGVCRNAQAVERAITEAVDTAVAAWASSDDPAGQREVSTRVETKMRIEVERATAAGRAQGAVDETASVMGRLTAEQAAAEYRKSALKLFAHASEAEKEAQAAFSAEMRRRHLHACDEDARAAAEQAASTACRRTAEYLLTTRVSALRAQRSEPPEIEEPDPYVLAVDRVRAQIRPPRTRTGHERHSVAWRRPTKGG